MAVKFKEYAIGEVAEVIGGSTPSTADDSNFGGDIPWLTPKDLSRAHDRYIKRGERNLTKKGLASCSAQILPKNSVLLSSRAPIGYLAIAANPITTNQGFRSLIMKPGFDHEFVYYWLLGNLDELERRSTGSTFKELSGSALKEIKITVPPLPEQRAIAHILGTLDDKIELNRKMNETLEAMARALFKSWFVDFDPVRAKAEGRDTGLPKEIADLFPDEFEDSVLGEIPKGWKIGCVGEEFNITMGQSPPGETYNEVGEGLPFYQGRSDFGFRYPKRRVFCTAPKRFAQKGDTLVSVRAPVGDINMAFEECAIGRGVAAAIHKSRSRGFSFQFMKEIEDVFAKFEAEGTVFGSINKDDFNDIPCVIPPECLVLLYEEIVQPFDGSVGNGESEIQTLSDIRETLLPKLISGELGVPEAELLIEQEALI